MNIIQKKLPNYFHVTNNWNPDWKILKTYTICIGTLTYKIINNKNYLHE